MQIGVRGAALRIALRTVGHLQLQLERGQRRTQGVGGIGDERALVRQRIAQAGEQIVQRGGQRADLGGQPVGGQRRQRSGIARLHLTGHRAQRRQAAPHRQPHQPGQQRQQDQQRRDGAQRHAGRHLVPRTVRLGDLHHRRPEGDAVHAPCALRRDHIGEAQLGLGRQVGARVRQVEAAAGAVPDADHHVVVVGDAGQRRRRRVDPLAGQRGGHLLHLVVEQRIGLLAGLRIDEERGGDDAREQPARQPPQQGLANGLHGALLSVGTIGGFRGRRRHLTRNHVPHAADVLDEVTAQLLAQRMDVHLDRVAADLFVPAVQVVL